MGESGRALHGLRAGAALSYDLAALESLRATYELTLRRGESAREKARWIAYEQTLELPPGVAPPAVERRFAARVEEVRETSRGRALARLAYSPRLVDSASQLVNVLFGNVSMQSGVRLVALEWPAALLRRLGGPGHGIGGVRVACGVPSRRALSCVALKPVGLTARELARRASELARGGVDLLKEDQGLADQSMARFEERVSRCQEAVGRANAGGRSALYLPHLTGAGETFAGRLELARRVGCRGVMVAPMLNGFDAIAAARDAGMVVLAHPSLSGGLLARGHGIAPAVLWGDLFRVAGADGVVYPHAGGRFPISLADCLSVAERLRGPLGRLRPAFPVIGGGVDLERVPRWLRRYGPDLVVLIGAGLYREPDLEAAAAGLREALERG
jgi:S-methyl-5-thioribulose 1-phosphate isomerase